MFPANNGDAFLIRESSLQSSATILIDGGFDKTYREFILPELQMLNREGSRLNLVIVTHIDADHISGIISMLKANGPAASPNIIGVDHVWHNSLRSITGLGPTDATSTRADQEVLSAICSAGFDTSTGDQNNIQEISGRQGSSLAALLRGGHYMWNGETGKISICTNTPPQSIAGTRVHVLGPRTDRLEALRQSWVMELRQLGVLGHISGHSSFDDAFEFMTFASRQELGSVAVEVAHRSDAEMALSEAYIPDTSPNNGSSISVLVETPAARMLFLGDAWAEDTVEALRPFTPGAAPEVFDAIKVSHHGSRRNTSPRLLELIDSPVYLISSDGRKHDHPDLPVLRAIVDRP